MSSSHVTLDTAPLPSKTSVAGGGASSTSSSHTTTTSISLLVSEKPSAAASHASSPLRLPNPDLPAEKPKAIDLSHHLNTLARSRKANSLKELYQYANRPGMVALAGGLPSPEYFPFESLSAEVYPYDKLAKTPPTLNVSHDLVSSSDVTLQSLTTGQPQTTVKPQGFFSWLFGKKPNIEISVAKQPSASNPRDPLDINLSTLLQYSSAEGHPALQAFIREFTEKVYQPAYADWQVLVHVGATAGWNQVVNLLMERGDALLVEEWTYPGATGPYVPLDVQQVPIRMDGEGIIPGELERTLAEWDPASHNGAKRPKLMYTVPTGQNPTGATMLAARKKQIYDICVKYDVIICEDEPYYFLYADPWVSQKNRKAAPIHPTKEKGMEDFLKKLPPSYLKFDYQGRVIRLDTFSKTIAPGSRLGWFVCNPIFQERLLRATESTTQAPCGLGQAMITKLLTTWKYEGYIRWLRGIKATYAMRRDWMCDLFETVFHLEFDNALGAPFDDSIRWATAYPRALPGTAGNSLIDEKSGFKSKKALLSFVPPTAGMFVWLAVHLESHPEFVQMKRQGVEDPSRLLMERLWKELAENNVLVSPGYFFDGNGGHPHVGAENIGFFRLSFSIASHDQMEKAVKTMYKVFVKFFQA